MYIEPRQILTSFSCLWAHDELDHGTSTLYNRTTSFNIKLSLHYWKRKQFMWIEILRKECNFTYLKDSPWNRSHWFWSWLDLIMIMVRVEIHPSSHFTRDINTFRRFRMNQKHERTICCNTCTSDLKIIISFKVLSFRFPICCWDY